MQRRTFLKNTTLAATAASIGGAAVAQDKAEAEAKPKERPGSNRGVIYKAVKTGGTLKPDQLKKLQDLGFDGVEGVSPGVKDKAAYMEVVRASGMPVHGVVDMVHWKQRLSSPDPAVREIGRKALEQAVIDAKEFGGSSVLLVPGRVGGDDETHDHVWERSITEIRKVIPTASKLGIHILIETVWNGFCLKPETFRDYLDEIGNPWVGAYFDIGNMQKFAPAHE